LRAFPRSLRKSEEGIVALDLQFGPVLAEFPSLMDGLWLTVELTLASMFLHSKLRQ
jgi:hypothetical protein